MRILMTAVLLCASSPMAWAQHSAQPPAPADLITHVRTAGDLAAVCTPAWHGVPRLEAIAYCQGFLTGVGQYHAALHTVGGSLRPLYCVPSPGPTIAESGVAYAAWLQSNPAHRGESAVDGLLRWAQATFPCPQQMPARTRHPAR